jgi:hypothetical protein
MRKLALLGATALVAVCAVPVAFARGTDDSSPKPPEKKDTACTGPLGPVTVAGNLYVPSGASCQLNGTKVLGDVTVYPTASLDASSAFVRHDLICAQAICQLSSSTEIGDDVTALPGTTFSADQSTIDDQLECDGSSCTLTSATVGKNVKVGEKPKLSGGTFSATDSTIGGKLDCEEQTMCGLDCADMFTCSEVSGTSVRGDVRVEAAAFLVANNATIGGSVRCDGCTDAQLYNSSIRGSVKSSGQANPGLVCNNVIGGSVHYTQDGGGFLACGGNNIRGSLHVTQVGGFISIVGNTVGGSLHVSFNTALFILMIENNVRGAIQCKSNTTPPPPLAFGNTGSHIDPACNEILL